MNASTRINLVAVAMLDAVSIALAGGAMDALDCQATDLLRRKDHEADRR